jgi:seryl-tRNA synthetase
MIDLALLREQPELYRVACEQKGIRFDIDAFLSLDERYRELKGQVELERAEQNAVSKLIPSLKGDEKQAKLEEMKALAERVKVGGSQLKELEAEWHALQLRLPGIPVAGVPVGADESGNVETHRWGTLPTFSFAPLDHLTLGKKLGIVDVERGVKIAGSRAYFLVGDGARLQHAVLNFALDFLHKRGFTIMDVPHLVNYAAMEGTSYFPGGEDQAYHLDVRDDNTYLIGTSEVSVAAFHSDEILEQKQLPLRYAGYSPCYRREAGTYGRDSHGLYRVHQFYKVEQVIVSEHDAEDSEKLHYELLGNAEDFMKALGLPYRVLALCTGDMGQGQVRKHDIEAWMPSRDAYGETHSCSTFLDFQARRLQMRYRTDSGRKLYCYTLNNTLAALPRLLIPLLENNQQADGSVLIPSVLRPYMGGQESITVNK